MKDNSTIKQESTTFFIRTLHPVGQGAFFTEQFFDENHQCIFNVVYDCGAVGKDAKKRLEREIDDTYQNNCKIDFLFISHFDSDHINGIAYMINQGYLTKDSIVIVPFNHPQIIKIMSLFDSHYQDISFLFNEFKGKKIKVIEIEEDIENKQGEGVINIEDFIKNGNNINDTNTIPSGKLLSLGDIWYYIPFNINEQSQLSKFKELLKKEGIDEAKLEQANYIEDNKASLREIYKSIKGKDKGNTTNINMNSLQLLSYVNREKVYHGHERYGYHHCWFFCDEYMNFKTNEHLCSCLYTGDTNLSNKNYKRLINKIKNKLNKKESETCKLMMIQMPHHGSKNNYELDIIQNSEMMTGFTNFDPDYKIFESKICMYFALNRKPLFLITNEYSSRYQYYVFLKK